MVFYSKSRWSSINLMVTRLLKLKSVFLALPNAILHEGEARGIDPTFVLPAELLETIMSQEFWKTASLMHKVFDFICK